MTAKLKNKIIILILLVLFSVSVWIGCSPSTKHILPSSNLEVLAFYEKGWNDLTFGYSSLVKHYKNFDILIPYWYTLHGDSSLGISKIGFEKKVVDFMKKHPDKKLVPLINSQKDTQITLKSKEARTKAINNIVKKVMDNNYDGVNIDFELLSPDRKSDLTAFIKELSQKLKSQKKLLLISVFPKVDVPEEVSGVYDYKTLAQYVDFITIMTYDKHSDSSGPGSVAPYKWVEQNINYASKFIPKNKLIVCIGAYGYDWPVPPATGDIEYIGLKEALSRAKEKGAKIQWDDNSQSPFYIYYTNGAEHIVWFENGYSASRKIAIAKKSGIHGIAVWRIGFEDEEFWPKLKQAINK